MKALSEIYKLYPITTKYLASEVERSDSRIRQLAPVLQEEELAIKIGLEWMFKPEAITYILNNR